MTKLMALLILLIVSGSAAPDPSSGHLQAPAEIVVVEGTPEQHAAVESALGHFAAAELELPSVEISFSDAATDCAGHVGLFLPNKGRRKIIICSDLAFVITHELAHAWADAHLGTTERLDYAHARGFRSWNDHGDEWGDRGVEDAAFVMQQNLMDLGGAADSDRWHDLVSGYELLTGRRSPLRASNR